MSSLLFVNRLACQDWPWRAVHKPVAPLVELRAKQPGCDCAAYEPSQVAPDMSIPDFRPLCGERMAQSILEVLWSACLAQQQ